MNPKIFVGKIYKVRTRTVKPEYRPGKKMPSDFWYSTVDFLEEVLA